MDGGTGMERRQSLALLVEDGASKVLELWLVKYDSCHFSPVSFASADPNQRSESVVEGTPSALPSPHIVFPVPKGRRCEDDEGAVLGSTNPVLYARTRTIGSAADGLSSVRLEVSGSRGVGAVVTNHPTLGTAVIDLYDLEEDEEDEEVSDEESNVDVMQTD
jgi:hypothetical protein